MKSTTGDQIGTIAFDLDGTLKEAGKRVSPALAGRLASLRASGVRLVLVTGRCQSEAGEFVELGLFDALVLENGSLVVCGEGRDVLAPADWGSTRRRLLERFPRGCEEVIVSMDRETEADARIVAGELGAAVEVNKDRLMITPPGTDKAYGLVHALGLLGSSPDELMCVGDGENDLAMFRVARLRVALKNSVDALKSEASYVASHDDGEGVIEAVDALFGGEAPG